MHSSEEIGFSADWGQVHTISTLVLPGLLGNVNMPSIGNGIGSYSENRDGLLDMVGSTVNNQCQSLSPSSEAFQLAVKGLELDEDSDCESPRTSEGSSEVSFEKMEDPVWFREGEKRGLSPLSVKALEGVVGQVLENVRGAGYGEAGCPEFRQYFSRLPSRYYFF